MPLIPYNKPWLSQVDQIKMLQGRGLVIADPNAAAHFLGHLNYYRFGGYCLAFELSRHTFYPNTTFEQIREAYEFDRTLRDLLTESLEVIELDFRTAVAYPFGQKYGAFGHTVPTNFHRGFDHQRFMDTLRDEAKRSRELFVVHFRNKYLEFPNLPIWIVTEVMSFGALSMMFKGMERIDQRTIASRYGVQPSVMSSWLHHLVYLRNLCAHHSRVWDRVWAIKPDLPAGNNWSSPALPGNDRLFATLLLQSSLLKRCLTMTAFTADWKKRVQDLIAKPPATPVAATLMGLTESWTAHPCWGVINQSDWSANE